MSAGGFDTQLAVAYNDIDYCLKLRSKNKLIVYVPYAQWYHLESVSRGYDYEDNNKKVRLEEETRIFTYRWKDVLEHTDPYYNKNLTTRRFDFSIKGEE